MSKPPDHTYKPAVPVDPSTLSPDEERFAVLLFQAKNQRQQSACYLEVYPAKRSWKPTTINSLASLLATKVELRVKQLQEAVAATVIANAVERQTYWTTTMRSQAEETRDRLRASELLGKAQRDFEPTTPSVPVTQNNFYFDSWPVEELALLREAIRSGQLQAFMASRMIEGRKSP